MSNGNHYDVIIIGTGAGGGTLAYRLAPSGKRILLLERGDYVPREKDNWISKAVVLEGKYKAHDIWRDKDGNEFHPSTNYNVGGNTKFYGAALFRFRKEDFGVIRHHGGISPAWPIDYEDMAPYYLQAEHLYHVHGNRGEDPTEPPETVPFPHPAVSHEPRIQQLHDDLVERGHRPFHVPLGIMLNEQNRPKSACIRCSTCDGFPCLVNAKSDAQVCAVDPALEYPNVTLLTRTRVQRLDTDATGHTVTGVQVERDGEQMTFSADIVAVSCGAINSAALLLKSANDRHPNGLGNSSDMVGRNYMCHNNATLLAISRTPNPTVFQKTIALNDFYHFADDWDYPLGHISMIGKTDMDVLRAGAPKFAPGMALDVLAKHAIDFWLTSEDLPDPDNRVLVHRDGQITLHHTPNNLEGHERLVHKLKMLLGEIGLEDHLMHNAFYLGKEIPLAGVAHQCGTVRFGNDPQTSALDVHCKMHDLDNLYVVDGSFFVSSSAVNPALTIMANALRVGDHLLERLQ
ncbi:MAG TPA: GMC family oxidoreductase [Chthonomonadaceae bacterium]|nr:GMC family oxidoreductase [Chthonomonadaceae bacterium]